MTIVSKTLERLVSLYHQHVLTKPWTRTHTQEGEKKNASLFIKSVSGTGVLVTVISGGCGLEGEDGPDTPTVATTDTLW